MKRNRIILSLCYIILGTCISAQSGSIKYFGQFYNYGLSDMAGVRQTLTYAHPLSNRLLFEVQVFAGNGRGRDISHNFKRDFILFSKDNADNIPGFLAEFFPYYEGIHSYQRISNGLRQDYGWGLSLNYLIYKKGKFSSDISLGYLVYQTKTIVRDNIVEIKITSTTFPNTITDYQITFPPSIFMNYRDGAGFARACINYNIKHRLSLSLNVNINQSLWGSGIDTGGGIGFFYLINSNNYE